MNDFRGKKKNQFSWYYRSVYSSKREELRFKNNGRNDKLYTNDGRRFRLSINNGVNVL